MRLLATTLLLLLALAAPAAAEQLVATQGDVRLLAHVDEQGRICQRLEGLGTGADGDLGCAAPPADAVGDPAAAFGELHYGTTGTVRVGLVSGGTTALRIVGQRVVPTLAGPSPLARHVLMPVTGFLVPRTVVALGSLGEFRAVEDLRGPPQFSPGAAGTTPLRGQVASAALSPVLDEPASLAAGRIVRRPRACLTFYVYRAPLSELRCFPPGPTGPRSCRDIYGTFVLGFATARTRTIEVRGPAGRRLVRRRVAPLPPRYGDTSAYALLLPSPAPAVTRVLLRDARGRLLLDRRGTPGCAALRPSGGTSPTA